MPTRRTHGTRHPAMTKPATIAGSTPNEASAVKRSLVTSFIKYTAHVTRGQEEKRQKRPPKRVESRFSGAYLRIASSWRPDQVAASQHQKLRGEPQWPRASMLPNATQIKAKHETLQTVRSTKQVSKQQCEQHRRMTIQQHHLKRVRFLRQHQPETRRLHCPGAPDTYSCDSTLTRKLIRPPPATVKCPKRVSFRRSGKSHLSRHAFAHTKRAKTCGFFSNVFVPVTLPERTHVFVPVSRTMNRMTQH